MIRRTLLAAAAGVALLSAAAASAEEYRLGLITPPPHQWTVFAQKAADEIRTAAGYEKRALPTIDRPELQEGGDPAADDPKAKKAA